MLTENQTCILLALIIVFLVVASDMERTRSIRKCGADCESKKKPTPPPAEAAGETDEVVAARAAAQVALPEVDGVAAPGDSMSRSDRISQIQAATTKGINPSMECPTATRQVGIGGPLQTALAFSSCNGDASSRAASYQCSEPKLPSATCMWANAPPQLPMMPMIDETSMPPNTEEAME